MSLRESGLGRAYCRAIEQGLIPALAASRLSANQLTVAGALLAAFVPLGFWASPWLGLVLLALSAMADTLDGPLSRALNNPTRWGAFLDSTVDRASDFFYLTGFWVLFLERGRAGVAETLLAFSAAFLGLLISYARARAEGLGLECKVGIFDRGPRTIYLLVWALALCLMPDARLFVLWTGLLVFWGLALITVLQRMEHVWKELRRQE
jgi:CDP-diacylglycerol--glycerol-3-phosphate 3-phosphatidyltransferase